MKFGERLKNLRNKFSISGYRLGILTDRPRQFISNIENGHRPPPDDFLKKLSEIEVFCITYDQLKAWALEDKYTNAQIELARTNFLQHTVDPNLRVPLIHNVSFINLESINSIEEKNVLNWIYTTNKIPDRTFAVKISDNALAPKVEVNDVVIVEFMKNLKLLKNKHIYIFQNIKKEFIARIVYQTNDKTYLLPLNYQAYPAHEHNNSIILLVGKPNELIKNNNFFISDEKLNLITNQLEIN